MRALLGIGIIVTFATHLLAQQEQRSDRTPRFAQLFRLPGIEWTERQQDKIAELRKTYEPKLAEIQRQRNRLQTPEQRQAQRMAMEAAQAAGKQGAELREAADESVKLTAGQQQEVNRLQEQQRTLVAEIQQELRLLLTDQQRAAPQRRNQPPSGQATPPTYRNLKYGPHDRNLMDVWLANSKQPTPVLVSIHGGGFRGGNKSVDPGLLRECLDAGISVVAITYRLSDEAIAPAQFHDAARAIQFIRHQAQEWKSDPQRIAATGSSAGAGLSLWLGTHDDLADPDSEDPVRRQSTRLTCTSIYNGQTSYDPRFIRDLFPGTDTHLHPALPQFFGADLTRIDDLPQEKYRLFEQVSAINHLTKDDAPAQLIYASEMDTPISSQGVGIHHPRFGKVFKQKMDKLGIECEVQTGVRRGSDQWTKLTMEFVKRHLTVQ